MNSEATFALFIELPNLQTHYDPLLDSMYILGTCCFRLYMFSYKDFAVPLHHPMFDPSAPYIAIPLHMAQLALAPAPAPVPPPAPASPPPHVLISSDCDPFEEAASSPSSSGSDGDSYAPASASMANGFLSSKSG